MDFLVLAPPVCTPSEPPSGAFILAAGLAGHGFETGFWDLSLDFFDQFFNDQTQATPSLAGTIKYLRDGSTCYEPMLHRSATGMIHRTLSDVKNDFPGFNMTLMDLQPPYGSHNPSEAKDAIVQPDYRSPFSSFWDTALGPVLRAYKPKQILISLAYLSQLGPTIELEQYLLKQGHAPIVGGSLPSSMALTAKGLDSLRGVFNHVEIGDGLSLTGVSEGKLLDKLAWPTIVSQSRYFSRKPIIPLTLSRGCYWNNCLFCPDRDMGYTGASTDAIGRFFETVPKDIMSQKPVIHLLDSAMPPGTLRRFLPIAKSHGIQFYGFARPTKKLMANNLIEEAASSGLIMLQLGVESGSKNLLDRFDKGLEPLESKEVIQRSAAAGVRTYLYLLFGLPGETANDRTLTRDLILSDIDSIDFLNCSIFNLPRYCELTQRADEYGITLHDFPGADDIKLYRPFTMAGQNPRREARLFLNKEFLNHPEIRPAVLRTPRWLRAAHLALMGREGRVDPFE